MSLVAWTDREGDPGPLSPPSLSHQPFPALAVHPVYGQVSLCGHLHPPAGLSACIGENGHLWPASSEE